MEIPAERNLFSNNDLTRDRESFRRSYAGGPPWDIGKPQRAFRAAADKVVGSILDAGCGTGEHALFFAARGHAVTSRSVQEGVVVAINRTVRTDVGLRVVSVSESVTVNAGAPPVSTDDATVAETLSTRSVVDLPLNGRDALKLAANTSAVIVEPKSTQPGVPPGQDVTRAI